MRDLSVFSACLSFAVSGVCRQAFFVVSVQGVRALEANGALDAAQLLHMTAGEVLSEVGRRMRKCHHPPASELQP